MLYVFIDEATGDKKIIKADSHPDAIDIAYEIMYQPAFQYVIED